MANQIVQNTIYQLSDTLGSGLGVIDECYSIISYDESRRVSENLAQIISIASETDRIFTYDGYTFLCPSSSPTTDYIYYAPGTDEAAARNVSVLSIALGSLKRLHDDKFDKLNFMKNVILDNILTGDLVKTTNTSDFSAADVLRNLYPDRSNDFVISLDANTIVLIKSVSNDISHDESNDIAKTILSTLNSEALIQAVIGIGTIAPTIGTLAKSYKDASVALEVGKVFDTEKSIVDYDNLGIARLIYHLPTTLCEIFLNEVFKKESIDVLDQETIYTIQKFFENNLNVSETSRQLYVHRNTLVYRLDKVEKLTGLDLRIFEHAIVFKVAMMVKKYLVSNPIKI